MYIRQLRLVAPLATLAVLEAAIPAAASATPDHPARHIVRPGQSIQAAVDAARPGDTVLVLPGTYRQRVTITVPGLTLRGVGGRTVIAAPAASAAKPPAAKPPAATKPDPAAKKPPAATKPGPAGKTDPATKPGSAPTAPSATPADAAAAAEAAPCATDHGICVLGTKQRPVQGVAIRNLTVRGFAKNGVWGNRTDRMSVHGVTAEDNGAYGISQEWSTRTDLRRNDAHRNGQAGILIANTTAEEAAAIDTRGTVVRDNELADNRIGVVLRRVRNLTVEQNTVTGNCGGVFVVGDESIPRGGALTVTRNNVHHNNRYCAATARLPFIQGTGILLTGVEETRVTANQVRGHTGKSPMSGGVVLFKSVVGTANSRNTISDNEVRGNSPADLDDQDRGPGNAFTGNRCDRSVPEGRC
ncbi:right-handed parallel beta-helix repeat-containing protein [Streptomyces sp. NPDC018031]|uniref:right-handed parallel beta-helix repeat-containing protein n=1 Tax=Streptomyces sp. NPDC018031 TaxID=3365033 RepID=UPI0037B4093E